MNYGEVLRRALDITWRHKILWVFGVAAVLFGGAASGGGRGGQGWQYALQSADLERWGQAGPGSINWSAVVPIIAALVGIAMVVAFVLFIIGLVVRYTSYGALIAGVDEIERSERTDFGSALSAGWPRFLHLLVIDILIAIGLIVVALILLVLFGLGLAIVIVPALVIAGSGNGSVWLGIVWGVLTGICWLVLLAIIALAISGFVTLLRELAYRASVIDRRGIFESIGDAYGLIRERLEQAGLMWLILLGIKIVVSMVAIPLVVLGASIIALILGLLYNATGSVASVLIIGLPLAVIAGLAAAFVGGVYYTFVSSAWTLTYRNLRPISPSVETQTV